MPEFVIIKIILQLEVNIGFSREYLSLKDNSVIIKGLYTFDIAYLNQYGSSFYPYRGVAARQFHGVSNDLHFVGQADSLCYYFGVRSLQFLGWDSNGEDRIYSPSDCRTFAKGLSYLCRIPQEFLPYARIKRHDRIPIIEFIGRYNTRFICNICDYIYNLLQRSFGKVFTLFPRTNHDFSSLSSQDNLYQDRYLRQAYSRAAYYYRRLRSWFPSNCTSIRKGSLYFFYYFIRS